MKKTIELPDTIKACHELIIKMAAQIEQLQRRAFGSLKDRVVKYDGPSLFDDINEQEQKAALAKLEKARSEAEEAAKLRRRKIEEAKKRPERPQKYNLSGLPEQKRIVYPEGIAPEQYEVIGRDVTRLIHVEPQRLWVEVIERPVLRRKEDKWSLSPTILQAPRPNTIPGATHAGADLLATVVNNKFTHHLPEYRQIKMFSELGVKIPASTVNDWVHAVADALYPLYHLQRDAVLRGGYVQIDEVPWRIADRKGAACRKGYAWQFMDVSPNRRGTYFYYHKGSRGGEIPRTQLTGYQGAIQTDGYNVYDYFDNAPGITTLACMAHIRRKFIEAQSANPAASEAVEYIATLYSIEADLKDADATPEQIYQTRQQLSVPILEGIKAWMTIAYDNCTPTDPLAKAIKYAFSLWPRVMRYTENGTYRIDSNPVERGQRPTVLGRKNYLFSKSDAGAVDNAVIYTFLVSCDTLGINPYQWLKQTLEKINLDMDERQLAQLLPYNFKS